MKRLGSVWERVGVRLYDRVLMRSAERVRSRVACVAEVYQRLGARVERHARTLPAWRYPYL
jgi:hypothetical protein